LYEIGYNVGKIVYLIDSCIDILDDIEKQQFNALLAAYQDSNGFSATHSQHEVIHLVIDSLRTIQTLTKQLTLYQHQSLFEGILLQGFPAHIHQQIHKSIKKLKKNTVVPFNYLPHAALASALCFFTNEANAAFVWGEEYNLDDFCWMDHNLKAYGYMCGDGGTKGIYTEMCCNPCSCVISKDIGYTSICCNMPKCGMLLGIINLVSESSIKEIASLTLPIIIIVGTIFFIGKGAYEDYMNYSEDYNKSEETITYYDYIEERKEMLEKEKSILEKKESSIQYFIENTSHSFVKNISPELQLNIQKINTSITTIKSKVQNLQELQKQYPVQKDVIQPKISKLNKLKNNLEETLYNIQMQLRKAYVVYEADKIEGIGQSASFDEIIKQANEVLQNAETIAISVEETLQ